MAPVIGPVRSPTGRRVPEQVLPSVLRTSDAIRERPGGRSCRPCWSRLSMARRCLELPSDRGHRLRRSTMRPHDGGHEARDRDSGRFGERAGLGHRTAPSVTHRDDRRHRRHDRDVTNTADTVVDCRRARSRRRSPRTWPMWSRASRRRSFPACSRAQTGAILDLPAGEAAGPAVELAADTVAVAQPADRHDRGGRDRGSITEAAHTSTDAVSDIDARARIRRLPPAMRSRTSPSRLRRRATAC